MTPELFDFQKEGSLWLRDRRHALLADEMGLGKTPQAIVAAKNDNDILVVTPSCAKINWQREFARWAGRKAYVSGDKECHEKRDTVIASYEYITNYLDNFTHKTWSTVIIDESHFTKEPTSKRTIAVLGKRGLIHSTKKFWCLSGTPAPNHAGELWPLLYTMRFTPLSYDGFTARYCNSYKTSRYGRTQIVGSNTKHTPELKAILKQMSLRRKKEDVLKDLPPIFYSTTVVDSPYDPLQNYPELRVKMESELKRLQERIDFHADVSDAEILNALSIMAQSTPALQRYVGLKLLQPATALLTHELQAGLYSKIVVFAIHRDVIENLARSLKVFNPVILYGGMSDAEKQHSVDRFQTDPSVKVFIGNIKAAGVGITLTAAHQVLFVEQSWTPGDNQQAADRCHRIGQAQFVSARFLGLKGFHEKIAGALSRKAKEIKTFID